MNPLETARDALFELDDVIGQLSDAIDVMEELTNGTMANKAMNPLHDHLENLERIIKEVWPIVVGKTAA